MKITTNSGRDFRRFLREGAGIVSEWRFGDRVQRVVRHGDGRLVHVEYRDGWIEQDTDVAVLAQVEKLSKPVEADDVIVSELENKQGVALLPSDESGLRDDKALLLSPLLWRPSPPKCKGL